MLSDRIIYMGDRVHAVEGALQEIKELSKGGQSQSETNASLMRIHNSVLLVLGILAEDEEEGEGSNE